MIGLPDSQLPTDEQRKKLCRLLYLALLEIRMSGWEDRAQEAADLADAFHNLPTGMWSESFSFDFFQQRLEAFRQKYPASFDFLREFDEIKALREGK